MDFLVILLQRNFPEEIGGQSLLTLRQEIKLAVKVQIKKKAEKEKKMLS